MPITRSADRTRIETACQLRAFDFLPFVPLGRYLQASAWRDNVRNIPKGPSPAFWDIEKA